MSRRRDASAYGVLRDEALLPRRTFPPEFRHLDDTSDRQLALHEAGHAVAASALRFGIDLVSIQPTVDAEGFVRPSISREDVPYPGYMVYMLSGRSAVFRGYPWLRLSYLGDRLDLADARLAVALEWSCLPSAAFIDAEIDRWQRKTDVFVDRRWGWIGRVRDSLCESRRLTGVEVSALRHGR